MTQLQHRQVAKRKPRSGRTLAATPRPPRAQVLDEHEAYALYDSLAREHLGMSAEEFERAWAAGKFRGRQEEYGVGIVLMMQSPKPAP